MKKSIVRDVRKDIAHYFFPNLNDLTDAREYHRLRLQVTISIICLAFSSVMSSVCWSVGLRFTPIVLMCASLLFIAALLMLRIGREAVNWLLLGTPTTMIAVWICIWETGFWQGGVVAWLTIGPVTATLYFKKAALPLLLANAIFAFVLFGMWCFGIQLPNQLTGASTALFSIINGIVLMFIIFWLADEMTENRATAYRDLKQSKEELAAAMTQLENTKSQLMQAEKMAALGELTAGIAHEIQNPLNFVNNFSELSVDLVQELKEELKRPAKDEAYIEELFDDLSKNQEKVNHHGKRASSIVKGMLGHSRANAGVREITNINDLADEYLRLSYHGLRAKDKSFNADFKTEFQDNLPKIAVIPQDLGRVFMNLMNNAFYAVNQRNQAPQPPEGENYVPTVIVSTRYVAPPLGAGGQILIKIKDNGTGMPESVKAKIFQPFFTTKPTGSGTGLGLSLAYDIVTKGHSGTLEVESTEGVGTEFIIRLPV